MKAMIFAAGLGTRLRPLTNDRPKALVALAGQTLLERAVRAVAAAGCASIVVNIHHIAPLMREAIDRLRPAVDAELLVSDESDLVLETGGGILAARDLLEGDEPILVHNVDIVTRNLDLNAMIDSHRKSGAMATLLVKDRPTRRYFLFDDDNRLGGWTNIETGELRPASLDGDRAAAMHRLAFGGIHVLAPSIFDQLEQYRATHGPVFSIANFYVEHSDRCFFHGYIPTRDYDWFDVGSPETLQRAASAL